MSGRVLLIEEDIPSMELMCHLLTAHGYFPLRARNGEEGVRIATRERPDLIVSEIHMPFVDGYEVARRIRADPALNGIPMLAVIVLAIPEERRRVLAAGYDGYVSRPITPLSFMRHVEAYSRPEFRAAAASAHSTSTDAPTRLRNGRRLLVVDDTPANLKLAAMIFGRAGYEVVTASGMGEALRIARQDPPDLILSDIVMEGGSGYEFIRAVKADGRLRSIPFVFNTSSMTVDSAREKSLALGAVKVLFRPIDPDDMLREIEACLGESPAAAPVALSPT
jgi:two-component system, cell cycle response regulator